MRLCNPTSTKEAKSKLVALLRGYSVTSIAAAGVRRSGALGSRNGEAWTLKSCNDL